MSRVRAELEVALEPAAAFDTLVDELALALARLGISFEPRPGGRVTENDVELGRVVDWQPGARIRLEWRPAPWQPDAATELELRLRPVDGGTRVTIDHRGWERVLGDSGSELAEWFAGQVAAPFLKATAASGLGDWLTDRAARRPSGPQARAVYRDPLYHRPNFRVLLQALALTADDHLLEVGCGGGALLHDALRSGCRAAGVDHSADMVRLAREVNRDAVAEGRLEVVQADAGRLPFPDDTFTCAVMTGVLGFLPDPVAALAEIRRVLVEGGRLAILGSDPECRGTPAAPEPIASRLQFYDDEALAQLGRNAGLADVRVERRNLGQYAREAGVPEEHLGLFSDGPGARFLFARKGRAPA